MAIELTDGGAGYTADDRPIVAIAPPPRVKIARDEARARRLRQESRNAAGGGATRLRALARSNTTCVGTTCVRVPGASR